MNDFKLNLNKGKLYFNTDLQYNLDLFINLCIYEAAKQYWHMQGKSLYNQGNYTLPNYTKLKKLKKYLKKLKTIDYSNSDKNYQLFSKYISKIYKLSNMFWI